VGAVYTPICGQVLCGQTRVGTWIAQEGRSKLLLNSRSFSITITEGPLITLVVNRPRLYLNAKALTRQTDTAPTVGRGKLLLNAKPFVIQPFIGLALNKPRLYLRGRATAIALSAILPFGRPKLTLLGGRLARVGRAGLIPTVPESRPLNPTTPGTGTLVPTAPASRTLVASATGTRPLQPTTDTPDVLLVPTVEEVR